MHGEKRQMHSMCTHPIYDFQLSKTYADLSIKKKKKLLVSKKKLVSFVYIFSFIYILVTHWEFKFSQVFQVNWCHLGIRSR